MTKKTKKPIRFVLWDMSGQTHFKRFRSRFYSGTSGAIIIYDLTNAQTYRNVQSWLKECTDNIRKQIPMILLGNKSDLTELRVELPRSAYPNITTIVTSAKNGDNVEKAFFQLFEEITEEQLEKGDQPEVKTTHISYENS